MRLLVQFSILACVLVQFLCSGYCPCCYNDPTPNVRTCYLNDPLPRLLDPTDPTDPAYIPGAVIGRRPKPIRPRVKVCLSPDPGDPSNPVGPGQVSVCCSAPSDPSDPSSSNYGSSSMVDPTGYYPGRPRPPVKVCSCCLYPNSQTCPQCYSVYYHG